MCNQRRSFKEIFRNGNIYLSATTFTERMEMSALVRRQPVIWLYIPRLMIIIPSERRSGFQSCHAASNTWFYSQSSSSNLGALCSSVHCCWKTTKLLCMRAHNTIIRANASETFSYKNSSRMHSWLTWNGEMWNKGWENMQSNYLFWLVLTSPTHQIMRMQWFLLKQRRNFRVPSPRHQ